MQAEDKQAKGAKLIKRIAELLIDGVIELDFDSMVDQYFCHQSMLACIVSSTIMTYATHAGKEDDPHSLVELFLDTLHKYMDDLKPTVDAKEAY